MTLVLVAVIAILAAAGAAWTSEAIGRRQVLTETEATDALSEILVEVAPVPPIEVPSALTLEAIAGAPRAAGPASLSHTVQPRPVTIMDGALPAGIAAGVGLYEWLTPDSAALAALAHVTGKEVNNALDFHAIVAGRALSGGKGYDFLTESSARNWMGHVGEQQIAEQVESWASAGSVEMPGSASFEGADITIFGEDFQVKFYEDFNKIVNQHGDTLIVNSDAANIPDGALRVDFSEPFDPSVLEGHDVIVAEGLTRAGAIDSWESAAGVWAGGMDVGDMAGEAFDAAIPGMGAAIAVAMQGYKRRKALSDESLRAEASKRIARDSLERVAAVSTGALVGGGLGILVDVATLGLTGGVGALGGAALGSWISGRKAAKVANRRDAQGINSARQRVVARTAAYGVAVENARAEAEGHWQDVLAEGERAAGALSERMTADTENIMSLAQRDLADALMLNPETAAALLRESRAAVRSLRRSGWSLPALRARAAWLSRTGSLTSSSTADEVLRAAIAAPGGRESVLSWLMPVNERRQSIMASADVAMRSLFLSAIEARMRIEQHLTSSRENINEKVADALRGPINSVADANENHRKELVLTGKAD